MDSFQIKIYDISIWWGSIIESLFHSVNRAIDDEHRLAIPN